jgi:diaminohydroxyphosphoribosylaminopyrimidine deaminase/5-amino-6-(5-phosphoribosylamino)uracil reductase
MKRDSLADERWMRRALRLAARGYTPPNPMVGCVLVRDGVVVGEGFHAYAGAPHAEARALEAAGENARGSTAYVSLEPCVHFGKTPPCTQALIAAGVQRVVVAVMDPNPQVAGKGIAELEQAGVEVCIGVLEEAARQLNEAYFFFHRTGRPFVMLKVAMTLDGKIATHTGDSRWITEQKARHYVHRLRAQSGAVLCGSGTVLRDDPLLTARCRSIPRQPLRVVLDSRLRIPPTAKIVQTAHESPVLLVTAPQADNTKAAALEASGVEIVRLPLGPDGHIALDALMEELSRRSITSVLVEGGGEIQAAFLASRHVQKLLWFIAPKLVGGQDAPSPIAGVGVATMAEAIRLSPLRVRRLGRDILLESAPLFCE